MKAYVPWDHWTSEKCLINVPIFRVFWSQWIPYDFSLPWQWWALGLHWCWIINSRIRPSERGSALHPSGLLCSSGPSAEMLTLLPQPAGQGWVPNWGEVAWKEKAKVQCQVKFSFSYQKKKKPKQPSIGYMGYIFSLSFDPQLFILISSLEHISSAGWFSCHQWCSLPKAGSV